MSFYRMYFFKVVSNDTGHERKICQRLIDIQASCPDRAVTQGQQLFCSLEGLPKWWLHADGYELERLPDQSRTKDGAGQILHSRT